MTILVASDLDRTMIFSEAAAAMPTPGVHDLVCVEHFRDQPLSYMTRAATGLLREVTDAALFVPTTTRTVEQYRRITLPGGPHRYAITSNGGNILVDSRPDEHWRAVVELRISDSGAPLDHVTGELSRRIDASWVHNFRVAEELFCYLVVDLAAVPVAFVDEWTQWANDRNWAVSVQGRKIYTVPVALCKSAAVAHLRSRLETRPECRDGVTVVAAGDGALDAELLQYADNAIRPRHGELERIGFHTPGLQITAAKGAAAGEEILRWMLALTAAHRVRGRPFVGQTATEPEP